jgi:hypothetical protein
MSKIKISPELRQFFAEEVRNDPNATLEMGLYHLRDLYELGPDDPSVEGIVDRISETQELLAARGEHTPLLEFL